LAFNRTVVLRYRFFLEQNNLAPSTINVRLAAVRRLAYEAADTGLLSPDLAAGIANLTPHDLRRTCARLCHLAGGELEQIQFLLGHASIHTTERYLGCKQKLRHAVNDKLGLEDC
jgi:integrase